jgi:hypothetical protein
MHMDYNDEKSARLQEVFEELWESDGDDDEEERPMAPRANPEGRRSAERNGDKEILRFPTPFGFTWPSRSDLFRRELGNLGTSSPTYLIYRTNKGERENRDQNLRNSSKNTRLEVFEESDGDSNEEELGNLDKLTAMVQEQGRREKQRSKPSKFVQKATKLLLSSGVCMHTKIGLDPNAR